MIERPSQRSISDLKNIRIDPEDPAVFQLSGGTTGIPKLIPRTHNDYHLQFQDCFGGDRRRREEDFSRRAAVGA